jgi:hypothetical protein
MDFSDLTVTPGGKVSWSLTLSSDDKGPTTELVLIADDVRNASTGIHAKVSVGKRRRKPNKSYIIDNDTFNIGRRDERNRLANSTWKEGFAPLDGQPELLSQMDMRQYLMRFTDAVYPAIQGEIKAILVLGDTTPIEYIARPHIVTDGGTILFGPGGAGKSTTALVCALSVQYGLSDFWDVPRPSNVLYVNVERSLQSIARRVGGIAPALGLPHDAELLSLSERGRTIAELGDKIDSTVREHDIEVVFFDSLTRAGLGDLSENKPANAFGDMMNSIAPTWVAVGHVGRKDHSHIYGSIMFDNCADCVVKLQSHEDLSENKLGVRMDITKSNDAPRNVPPVWLRYDYDPVTNAICGISTTNENEFPDLATSVVREGSVPDQIALFLSLEAENGKASAAHIASFLEKERANISAVLNANPRFVKVGKEGRAILYGLASQ